MRTPLLILSFLLCTLCAEAQNTDTIFLPIPSGTLYGVLKDMGPKSPVVLMIAGSGPTDHNGNSPGYNSQALLQLADSLALYGISSLRYDKRGIGKSEAPGMSEESMRLDTFVLDAARWIEWLDHKNSYASITVLGHSQGSLVGMLACEQEGERVQKYISLAGAGENIAEILKKQIAISAPKLSPYANPVFDSLKNGEPVDTVYPLLLNLLRPSIQPFLISWMRHEPGKILETLSQEILIVNGSHDIQVGVDQAEKLYAARPDARFELIEGMSHVLKQAPEERFANILTYNDPEKPIDSKLVHNIKYFILQ